MPDWALMQGTMTAWDALLWLYLIDATLLIIHEIDSAYWKEWELFRLPGGITFFLVLHLPLVFLALYGLVTVAERSVAGLIFALVISAGGAAAFVIHSVFILLGRPQFRAPISLAILVSTLAVSVALAVVAVRILRR
jgi:hypothetical protein